MWPGFFRREFSMCLALYIGAPKALPTVPWDPLKPAFHVIKLPKKGADVRRLLRCEHIYYVGSHEGCSCAFNYEHEFKSVLELRDYLRGALSIADEIEGFACRPGSEKLPVKHSIITSPDGIALPEFFFQDSQRIIIRSKKSLRARRRAIPERAAPKRRRARVTAPRLK